MIGASGTAGPATIFFPNNELLPRNIYSDKTTGNVSELTTDYSTSNDKLLSFMKLTFHPWLISKKKSFPVIVFIDINPVHISFALLSFCKECRIILLRTTPAIKLHPISSFIVPQLENEWTRALMNGNNMRGNRRIAMELIPSVFAKVLEKTITVDLLKDAFEKCGTFPFDPVTAHKQRMTSSASLQDISSSHRPDQTIRSITYPADAYLNQPTIEVIQQEVIAEPVPIEQNVVPTQAVHSTPQQTRTTHTIDQMAQFRILLGPLTYEFMNAGNSWTGAIENTSLFHVWQRLNKLYETTRPITQAAHPRAQEIDLQFLLQFEKLIGPLVFEFKKSGDVWTGAAENRSLFEVWQQLFMVDASTQTD